MEEQNVHEMKSEANEEQEFISPLLKKGIPRIKVTLGIIVTLFLGISFIAMYKNQVKPQNTTKTEIPTPQVYITEFRGEIPSSCGYSIGWPTSIVDNEQYIEWIYEEVSVLPDSFRGLAPSSVTNQGVLMATMLFKKQGEKFNSNVSKEIKFSITQPGLVSLCVNNIEKWDLNEFVDYIKKSSNDQLKYTIMEEKTVWGYITVQQIEVEGISSGGYVKEPFYLAVIPAGSEFSRLVIFQPWAAKEDRLETDRQALQQSLSERKLTSVLTIPKTKITGGNQNGSLNTSSNPECTQFKIYEGQFASDKCYLDQDLRDLQYYLKRYNNAVLDQNNAARSTVITCNGSGFFKSKCEEDKQQYEQALKDQEIYKVKVNETIAKGK